ncbi:MAG: hypothetical protein R2764_21345 [Bacteroidales bacterium]
MEFIRANPHLKSGESVPADSAVWLLEATINFSHAFPNEFYDETQTDEVTLTIPLKSNGIVDMVVLTQKYDEMKAGITTIYDSKSYENKALVLVDVINSAQTSDELTITAQTITGNKSNDPPPIPGVEGPFGEQDDWWYGENIGYCYDPYIVQDDAANQLFLETKDLVPDPAGNYYFINEFTFYIDGGDPDFIRDNDVMDNYLDYWLYYSVDGNPQLPFITDQMLCLEHTEMNIYHYNLKKLMFDILPNDYLPNTFGFYGYSIESLNKVEDKTFSIDDFDYYYHRSDFTYGIKVGYNEGEGPTGL